jgi:hypothetical protein
MNMSHYKKKKKKQYFWTVLNSPEQVKNRQESILDGLGKTI